MKNEFINGAAYELRTPIQPVLGLSQLLRSKTINADESDEFLDIIIRNAKRLADSILVVTRIESYSLILDKVRFNLNDLILNVMADMKTRIVNNKVELLSYRTSQDVFVEADKLTC
jgi:signal transduction histidine kinase